MQSEHSGSGSGHAGTNLRAQLHTLAEVRGASAAQDLNEGRAVFALPALAGLVQSPGVAVNQLLTDSISPASLWEK